jgi:hypothetical protein
VPISLIHPAARLGSANVAAFISAARAHFRENPVMAFTDTVFASSGHQELPSRG